MWYHFNKVFEYFPSVFQSIRLGSKTKATIVVTDDGKRKTFAISGQMTKSMIQMVRDQMNSLEAKHQRINS